MNGLADDSLFVHDVSISLVCSNVFAAMNDSLFLNTSTIINTIVFKNIDDKVFYPDQYNQWSEAISAYSIILQGSNTKNSLAKSIPSILALFRRQFTFYISFFDWQHTPIDSISLNFNHFNGFTSLRILQFKLNLLQILDETFKNVSLPNLHTLIIISSKLRLIHPMAFANKSAQLIKLILCNNELNNLAWLTLVPEPFQKLWYLDLSLNKLISLPSNLRSKLPVLQIFYLNDNNFKWFQLSSIEQWLGINEFRLAITGLKSS